MTADQVQWHWYISRPDEVFIDCDSSGRLFYAMRQVERNGERLRYREVHVYPSGTPKHYHLIVLTGSAMDPLERAVWGLHCGSDRRRQEYIFERIRRGKLCGDFLITPNPYPYRKPDRACACEAKHKDKSVTDACPVMQNLLGEERSALYFELDPRVQFKYGEVNLEEILKEDTRWKK